MSGEIISLNEEAIKRQLKELVRGTVEGTDSRQCGKKR